MFFLYLSEIIVSFLLAYYASYQYLGPSTEDGELANWISYVINNGENLIITFLLIVLIFIILDSPWKYIKKVNINRKIKKIHWKKTKAFLLLLLIFDVYFYIYLKFNWYFFIPLIFYLSAKFSLIFLLGSKASTSKRYRN